MSEPRETAPAATPLRPPGYQPMFAIKAYRDGFTDGVAETVKQIKQRFPAVVQMSEPFEDWLREIEEGVSNG